MYILNGDTVVNVHILHYISDHECPFRSSTVVHFLLASASSDILY